MASREELLRALEDRLILGEISEKTYKELKELLPSREENGSGAFFTNPEEYSVPPVHLDLPAGKTFQDRFVLMERVGAGGFGAVYLAEDRERGQKVALKVVSCAPGQSQVATEQLRQELRVRQQITDYRHVIQTYDIHAADHEGLPLILMAMEYAELGSLRRWLIENRHDQARRHTQGVEFFKQACLGVQAVHEAGLVHLDLKPENLLLCRGKDGRPVVKVSDLAISRSVEHFSQNPASVTRAGLGTPAYMSPEQFMAPRPKDVRFPSDIYSLGVVLFEILDGDPPFHGSPQELRERHISVEPPQLSGVDDSLVTVVVHCLTKKPNDRFRDVQQMLSVLAGEPPPPPEWNEDTSSPTEVEPAAICPVCGKKNEPTGTFRCTLCGQDDLCLSHFSEEKGVCEKCGVDAPPKELPEIMRRLGFNASDGVNAKRRDGRTPLHAAAARGDAEAASILLAAGADVNPCGGDNVLPLHMAAEKDHKDVVEILLSYGADPDAVQSGNRDRGQWTPLHYACFKGHTEVAMSLLDARADITLKDCNSRPPLDLAIYSGHLEVARMLLQAGADVNGQGEGDLPPVYHAVSRGNAAMVELLIQHGAHWFSFRGPHRNYTLLHVAAELGHGEVANLLLKCSADVNALTSDGFSPMAVAEARQQRFVCNLLHNCGGVRIEPET